VVGDVLPRSPVFELRKKSLVRAIILSVGAFFASLRLAGFPHIQDLHSSPWQILLWLVALWGAVETARCLRRSWNLYHAGVLILLYTNLLILTLIGVLAAYP
jgi:hypothetical protein